MWGLIRRAFCHHDYSIASEPGLVFLRCRNCEHRTAGWTIDRTVHPESGQTRGDRSQPRFSNAHIAPFTLPRSSGGSSR